MASSWPRYQTRPNAVSPSSVKWISTASPSLGRICSGARSNWAAAARAAACWRSRSAFSSSLSWLAGLGRCWSGRPAGGAWAFMDSPHSAQNLAFGSFGWPSRHGTGSFSGRGGTGAGRQLLAGRRDVDDALGTGQSCHAGGIVRSGGQLRERLPRQQVGDTRVTIGKTPVNSDRGLSLTCYCQLELPTPLL